MAEQSEKRPYIGGQAVIEGVMMRAPRGLSIAVRRPDGSLVVLEEPYAPKTAKLFKLPFLRGVATLGEALQLGWRALKFSAEQQVPEGEEMPEEEGKGAIVLSTLLALGLFVALPQLLASGSGKLFGIDFGLDDARFHVVIGAFKLLIVFLYMVGISRIPEIRRTFQFHGAEHKTIHAYEQDLELTVENVQAQTTLHPRCGTTFLVVVVLMSIVAGSLAAPLLLPAGLEGLLGQVTLLALRIALLPFIAAFSFELQRLSARYCTRGPLRVFLWPGFLFQKITTREPDDDQVEVAIAAMEAAAWRERASEDAPSPADASPAPALEPLVFPSFAGFRAALRSGLRSGQALGQG
ncbi:MAG: DUF1385 domain-containing protein [Myxococcota bacterium]